MKLNTFTVLALMAAPAVLAISPPAPCEVSYFDNSGESLISPCDERIKRCEDNQVCEVQYSKDRDVCLGVCVNKVLACDGSFCEGFPCTSSQVCVETEQSGVCEAACVTKTVDSPCQDATPCDLAKCASGYECVEVETADSCVARCDRACGENEVAVNPDSVCDLTCDDVREQESKIRREQKCLRPADYVLPTKACLCDDGYVRSFGKCIPIEDCASFTTDPCDSKDPCTYDSGAGTGVCAYLPNTQCRSFASDDGSKCDFTCEPICPSGEVKIDIGLTTSEDATCSEPNPFSTPSRVEKCDCVEGRVRNKDGECVLTESCPETDACKAIDFSPCAYTRCGFGTECVAAENPSTGECEASCVNLPCRDDEFKVRVTTGDLKYECLKDNCRLTDDGRSALTDACATRTDQFFSYTNACKCKEGYSVYARSADAYKLGEFVCIKSDSDVCLNKEEGKTDSEVGDIDIDVIRKDVFSECREKYESCKNNGKCSDREECYVEIGKYGECREACKVKEENRKGDGCEAGCSDDKECVVIDEGRVAFAACLDSDERDVVDTILTEVRTKLPEIATCLTKEVDRCTKDELDVKIAEELDAQLTAAFTTIDNGSPGPAGSAAHVSASAAAVALMLIASCAA